MIRHCLKRTSITRAIRLFTGSSTAAVQYGYECLRHSNISSDKLLLEKSINNGCRTVVTRSRSELMNLYELLFDLSDGDDVDLKTFTLGHILYQTNVDDDLREQWEELRPVAAFLNKCGHSLSFVSIPAPAVLKSNSIPTWLPKDCRIGIDLDSKFLTASAEEVSNSLSKIAEVARSHGQSGDAAERAISVITVATNPLTFRNAALVRDWSKQGEFFSELWVVATEVLRCNADSPLAIISSGYDAYSIPHRMTPSSAQDYSDADGEETGLSAALKDFSAAISRCIQVEKKFAEKLSEGKGTFGAAAVKSIPLTDLCWGQILSVAQQQFLHPEEWNYFFERQVKPKLNNHLDEFQRQGYEVAEWASLYGPMSSYMFSSFRNLLQQRSLLMSLEIASALASDSSSMRIEDDLMVQRVGMQLARMAAGVTDASAVVCSLTQVNASQWSECTNLNDADRAYDSIKAICSDYNQPAIE